MIEKAALSDYHELLSFENRVFHVPFLRKVPKLYRDPAVCTGSHRLVKENGKIVAAIAAWPGELQTPGGSLSAVGIGSVAVDPGCRGKGYMRDLMGCCEEIAKAQNADVGYLSGYRQRYGYYGYVPGGVKESFEVRDYFLDRHKPAKHYTFLPFLKDPAALPDLQALHSAQDYRWTRDDFFLIATTWYCRGWTVRDEAGAVAGYLITERFRRQIGELVLAQGAAAADVLVCFARARKLNGLRVTLAAGQTALREELLSFGEQPTIESPAMFKIFNFAHTIETLGTWKAQHCAMAAGTLVLDIGGETLRVSVKDGRCTAVPTADKADLTLTKEAATMALTSPFAAPTANALFNAWAPLCPLSLPHVDSV